MQLYVRVKFSYFSKRKHGSVCTIRRDKGSYLLETANLSSFFVASLAKSCLSLLDVLALQGHYTRVFIKQQYVYFLSFLLLL